MWPKTVTFYPSIVFRSLSVSFEVMYESFVRHAGWHRFRSSCPKFVYQEFLMPVVVGSLCCKWHIQLSPSISLCLVSRWCSEMWFLHRLLVARLCSVSLVFKFLKTLQLTLKMTTARVVKMSVTNNSFSGDYYWYYSEYYRFYLQLCPSWDKQVCSV